MGANTKKMAQSDADIRNMSLFKLGWPIFVQSLLAMCLGYIDTIMLSNYSDNAVGGIGNANQIMGFLTLTFSIISSATGVIVAQYIGAKIKDKLNEIYTVSVAFNLVISGVVSLIILLGSSFIAKAMKIPSPMVPYAEDYMSIVGGFIFLEALFDTFSQIFRNNGKTQIGMFIAIGMNLTNIIGNYCFLYGPLKFLNLGVKGVAISTTGSKLFAVVVAIIYFIFKIDGTIALRYLKPFPKNTLLKLLKLGLPTAGENISYNIAQLIILVFINSFNSTVYTNTKIYCTMLSNFAYLFSISAAMATAIVVGQAVGADDNEYAYGKVLSTLRLSLLISVCIAFANFLVSPFTLSLFTGNSEVISLGHKIMFICIFLEMGRTTNLVVINSMRAAGDVKFPTYLGMASMWGVSVLFGYLFGIVLNMGLTGIWIAMAMDEILRGVVVFIRWIKGGWRGKSVVERTA